MKIEKNIPIPNGTGKFKDIVCNMNIGDSVYVELDSDRVVLRNLLTRSGFKAVSRSEKEGFRVWKTIT